MEPSASGDADTALAPSSTGPMPAGHDLEALPEIDPALYIPGIEIGRGGMGRVLAARDRKLRRDVVIKVLRDRVYAARFAREALITARLQHPSIVRIYDAGQLDGEPFYAMEHVRGTTLERKVVEAEDARARLALLPRVISIADALAYAHDQGVIHRDLKPANIIVGEYGETIVIDWGLAKDLRANEDSLDRVPGPRDPSPEALASNLTVAGAVMGTPSYMSPEQARGERVDARTDVYAIGAILYTVLAGAPPFSGARALEDARAGGVTPLRERAPDTPDELVTIVEHAMAFEPGDRYASARELADDLRSYAAGKLVQRHAYSRGDLIKRWLRRYRAPVVILASVLGVLGTLALFSVRGLASARDDAESEAELLAARVHELEDGNDQLVLQQANRAMGSDPSTAIAWLQRLTRRGLDRARTRELAEQAATRGIAYELAGPKDDIEHALAVGTATAYTASRDGQLWRWHLNAFRGDKLGEQAGPIHALAVTSDGFWLATGGDDHVVRLWDLEQVRLRPLTGHTHPVRAVAFSPDGNTLASAGSDGLWLWNVVQGKGAHVDAPSVAALAWSVDGKRLWLGASDGRVVELEIASDKRVEHRVPAVRVLAVSPNGKHVAAGGGGAVHLVGDRVLLERAGEIADLAWTTDGKLVIAAGDQVHIHDLATAIVLAAGAPVLDVAIAGDHVAAGCADGKVRIWPLTGGTPRVLGSHRGAIAAVAFTNDVSKLVSAGTDDRLRLWPLAPPPPVPTGTELAQWLTARTNVVP